MLLSISSTAASLRLMPSVGSGSALQVATTSSCHDIVAPISAVLRLLLQARLSGTRCQTISVIRRLAKALLGDYWRHTCLRCSARNTLEALRNVLYKFSTYLLTYLLIYLKKQCNWTRRCFFQDVVYYLHGWTNVPIWQHSLRDLI